MIQTADPRGGFFQLLLRGFTCCVPEAKEGGVVLGVNAMEAGDIRKTDAPEQAYQMGKHL